MSNFEPEAFEDEKYSAYFSELQQAYKRSFDRMNDRYDSTLVHAIDQHVLSESEPFYEDGGFRIDLPEDPPPLDRVRNAGVMIDEEKLDEIMDIYMEELRTELRRVFDLEAGDE